MINRILPNIASLQCKYNFVRPLPYPFKSATSISSDVEFFEFSFFEELMKFLNSTENTALGNGLGLSVSSSFFFYATNNTTFGYLDGTDPSLPPGKHSRRLNDYLSAGYIDTNHAFGDFDEPGSLFTRAHAMRYYEELDKIGVKIPIFTNHGGPTNLQNIGKGYDYHSGDKKGSRSYHADLFLEGRVRFAWTDELYIEDLHRNQKGFAPKNDAFILKDIPLNDGSSMIGFNRYRGTGTLAPNFSSFDYQVKSIDWQELCKRNGIVIFYQHFGVAFKNYQGCHSASISFLKNNQHLLRPFYKLAELSDRGDVWVPRLLDLLEYLEMQRKLEINFKETENSQIFSIENAGKNFSNLCLYVNPRKEIRVVSNGKDLPIVYNGPDASKQYSVSVEPEKRELIW